MDNQLPTQSPQQTDGANSQLSTTQPGNQHGAQSVSAGMQKEREFPAGALVPELPHIREIGRDVELSPEVVKAGVNLVPTTVTLPKPIVAAGVQPAGVSQPVASGVSVVLPLSDEQITVGLKESVSSSLRWLAEWCVRRIKQIHALTKGSHA